MDDSATLTHPPPHFLWGLISSSAGRAVTPPDRCISHLSTSPDLGGSLECQEDRRALNRGLEDSPAWSQGWRAVREKQMEAGQGVHCQDYPRGSGWKRALPPPEVLLRLQNQRLFSETAGGAVIGTCFWKTNWQQVVRVLNTFPPSTY